MKKKFKCKGWCSGLRKCCLMMKFFMLFMLLTVLQVNAVVKSQETLLNVNVAHVSLVEVLKIIESKSDYTCLYSHEDVVKVDNLTYDLFVEYVDNYNDIKQILVDINLDENFNIFKYDKIEEKIEKSTIPFFEVPKILVVTKNNKDIKVPDKLDLDIDFVDINLSKLFKVI